MSHISRRLDAGRKVIASGLCVALVAAMAVISTVDAGSADAATSSSQQFATAVGASGAGGVVNSTRTLTFGATGVTAVEANTSVTGTCAMSTTTANPSGTAGLAAAWEPDPPPTGSITVQQTCAAPGGDRQSTLTFNRPVLDPILYVEGIDVSTLTVGGTSTTGAPITLTTLANNAAFSISGNTVSTSLTSDSAACTTSGCGSVQLSAASGAISSFSLDNAAAAGASTDTWQMGLSFPTVQLTKAFSPTTILAGATSELTFTITNPSNAAQPNLSPLDFTDTLAGGLILVNSATSNN